MGLTWPRRFGSSSCFSCRCCCFSCCSYGRSRCYRGCCSSRWWRTFQGVVDGSRDRIGPSRTTVIEIIHTYVPNHDSAQSFRQCVVTLRGCHSRIVVAYPIFGISWWDSIRSNRLSGILEELPTSSVNRVTNFIVRQCACFSCKGACECAARCVCWRYDSVR